MASVSQNLRATVSFGGRLDSSWLRSATNLRNDLQDVIQQSTRLRRRQAELAEEIRRAGQAGQSIRSLEREYARLSDEIRSADAAQQRLNRSLERQERMGRFLGRGQRLLGGGARFLGNTGLALGGGAVTSALGALIAPAAVNAHTAEMAGKATAYGVDFQTYMNWDALAKQYDMTGDNLGDLFEEYLHKAGEYKQLGKQSALSDAFETLGFQESDLAGLSDKEQFERVIDRAISLQDESKASFALDALLGGEASKFLKLIKRSGKSFQELMEEQQRYNLVTKQGADGALAGHKAVSDLQQVFSSAVAEISGQLGMELAPLIRQTAIDLAAWFKNGGITKIVTFLRDTLYPATLKFGEAVVFVGKVIFAAAKKLSWLLPDEQGDRRDVLENLGRWGNVDVARRLAEESGQGEWFKKQLRDNPGFVDDVKNAWSASQGRFFRDGAAFEKATEKYLTSEKVFDFSLSATDKDSAGNVLAAMADIPPDDGQVVTQLSDNSTKTFNFNIFAQPGQSEQGIADAIAGMIRTNPAFNGNNALFDGGEVW